MGQVPEKVQRCHVEQGTKEYLRGLREQHDLKQESKGSTMAVGDDIIHTEDRNRLK